MKDHHENIISRDDFIAVQHLIFNSKYGKQDFLPSIQIVNEGILKGFILVNIKWAGFKESDYMEACKATTKNKFLEKKKNTRIILNEGEFDLRGFEITRAQFINTARTINVTISINDIMFSTECISKFSDNSTVQLFLQPVEKLLAAKPCGKDDSYNVVWSKKRDGIMKNKKISNSAFLPTLYKIMGWKPECRYRCLGNIKELKNQKAVIFNLAEVEVIIPRDSIKNESDGVAPISAGKRSVIAFPAEWSDSFGSSVYEHQRSGDSILLSAENTIIGSESVPFDNGDLKITARETVGKEINRLITYFKGEGISDGNGD